MEMKLTEERDIIAELRVDLARLTQDLAHLQQDVAQIRLIFDRLAWLAVVSVAAAFLKFALEGGLAATLPPL